MNRFLSIFVVLLWLFEVASIFTPSRTLLELVSGYFKFVFAQVIVAIDYIEYHIGLYIHGRGTRNTDTESPSAIYYLRPWATAMAQDRNSIKIICRPKAGTYTTAQDTDALASSIFAAKAKPIPEAFTKFKMADRDCLFDFNSDPLFH